MYLDTCLGEGELDGFRLVLSGAPRVRKEHVVMVLGTLAQPGFVVGTRPMHSAQPIEEDVVSKQRDENNA